MKTRRTLSSRNSKLSHAHTHTQKHKYATNVHPRQRRPAHIPLNERIKGKANATKAPYEMLDHIAPNDCERSANVPTETKSATTTTRSTPYPFGRMFDPVCNVYVRAKTAQNFRFWTVYASQSFWIRYIADSPKKTTNIQNTNPIRFIYTEKPLKIWLDCYVEWRRRNKHRKHQWFSFWRRILTRCIVVRCAGTVFLVCKSRLCHLLFWVDAVIKNLTIHK